MPIIIIYGVKDKLTYIHVQHYNAGSGIGMDGNNYNQGTADYEVAMADMLLHGFPVGGNANNIFPALRSDQVMIGSKIQPATTVNQLDTLMAQFGLIATNECESIETLVSHFDELTICLAQEIC